MKIVRAMGRLNGRPPTLNPRPTAHLLAVSEAGELSPVELTDLFGVGRSTVYRVISRARATSSVVPVSPAID